MALRYSEFPIGNFERYYRCSDYLVVLKKINDRAVFYTLQIALYHMKGFGILIIFIFNLSHSFAQNKILQKHEMYVDFDYLTATLELVSPHLFLMKELTGYSNLDTIKSYRNEIENITNYDDFWKLVNKSLITCQDGHTHILTPNVAYEKLFDGLQLSLPIKYIDGKYVVTRTFIYDNIQFERGFELVQVNDLVIDSFALSVIPFRSNMKIDVKRGIYYFDNLIFAHNIIEKGDVYLTFKTNNSSEISKNFIFKESVQFVEDETIFEDTRKVEYWSEFKTLYIRIPSMNYADRKYYSGKISEVGKGKKIDKVIIDVRFNGGGSDFTWINVFRSLIADPLQLAYAIYGNETSYMTRKYKRIHGIKNLPPENIPFLNNHILYPLLKQSVTYKPYNNSLNLNCKIITVGNDYVYSSGASIFKVSSFKQDDNFYSIGTPTGTFLGSGFDGINFELPYSKIQFTIAPTIDLTNSYSISDIMQDKYDVTIFPNLNDYKIRYSYIGNVWSKDFLTNYDPYIINALKL